MGANKHSTALWFLFYILFYPFYRWILVLVFVWHYSFLNDVPIALSMEIMSKVIYTAFACVRLYIV